MKGRARSPKATFTDVVRIMASGTLKFPVFIKTQFFAEATGGGQFAILQGKVYRILERDGVIIAKICSLQSFTWRHATKPSRVRPQRTSIDYLPERDRPVMATET